LHNQYGAYIVNTSTVIDSHFALVDRRKANNFVSENPVQDLQIKGVIKYYFVNKKQA